MLGFNTPKNRQHIRAKTTQQNSLKDKLQVHIDSKNPPQDNWFYKP